MKKRKVIFFLLAIIYALLFFCKKAGIYFPYISDYLSDLICLPLSLLLAEIAMERLPSKKFKIGFWPILLAVVYFSLVFEFWMPSVSPNYTSDYWDILCYVLGGAAYYVFTRESNLFRKTLQPVQGFFQ